MPLSNRELAVIEARAGELIQNCHIIHPAVDVEIIAASLGLSVAAEPLDEVSGALIIQNNNSYIRYNTTHPPTRQRFTIAHELGHYYLHCDFKNVNRKDQLFVDKDFIVKYRNANNYTFAELKQEQEANAFAAALLMPRDFINSEINKKIYANVDEIKLIEKMAQVFKVSVPAMTYRLDNLSSLIYK
jgi:Zn-dependent peptidase ImmA (M78 family)